MSLYIYAADVTPIDATQPAAHITYQNIQGVSSIIYTCGDVAATFPAEALTKSTVLHNMITDCANIKENPSKTFLGAARWLLDAIDKQSIPLMIELLQQAPECFQENIWLSDGRSVHYKEAFKKIFLKKQELSAIDYNIIKNEREKYKN